MEDDSVAEVVMQLKMSMEPPMAHTVASYKSSGEKSRTLSFARLNPPR